jgi:hypothetical protein
LRSTDYFGLEVGVVEVSEVHENVVKADHQREDREDRGDDEAIIVEGGLAGFVAVHKAPFRGEVGQSRESLGIEAHILDLS